MNKSWAASSQGDVPLLEWVQLCQACLCGGLAQISAHCGARSSPPQLRPAPPRAVRQRQSRLVFSTQAPLSSLHIQLCVERAVCNRQYRPVKYLKRRISGNLTSALLITGTDSNKTEGKGVSGILASTADCCRPWGLLPSGLSSEPIQPCRIGGVEPQHLVPRPPSVTRYLFNLENNYSLLSIWFSSLGDESGKETPRYSINELYFFSLISYLGYPFFDFCRFFFKLGKYDNTFIGVLENTKQGYI